MKSCTVAAFLFFIGTCLTDAANEETPKPNSTTIASQTIAASNNSDVISTSLNDDIQDEGWEFENTTLVDTRRILYSKKVSPGKRPYMVYLSLTKESAKAHKYRGWLCGGVIVDPYYVLTSAACVEDADRFYVVSGTTKFVDSFDYKKDDCVCKHRRRVVWKCIPKNYKFDFQDSIKWSSNDVAIVKVDKPFKLGVLEKGCQFAADLICYNNISRSLEKPGTKGYIAGWGSGSNFREGVYRRGSDGEDGADGGGYKGGKGGSGGSGNGKSNQPLNAKCLQEAKVCIMDNEACAKKWAQRFRNIITQYMICTKDVMKRLSEICDKKYANCTDVETRRHDDEDLSDTSVKPFNIDLGRHLRDPDDYTARRSSMQGGFCENDHGGPLIVKYQGKERVIGVISACKIDAKSQSCHGPFLYTSVYKNRQFLSCAIHKDVEEDCRRVFRTGITHEEYTVDWAGYDDEDDDRIDAKISSAADSSDDSDDEKAILREKAQPDKNEKETDKKEADSSEEAQKQKKKNDDVKEETKEKSKKKDKKKAKKDKAKRDVGDEEAPVKKGKDVFYESSKDENVNEPVE